MRVFELRYYVSGKPEGGGSYAGSLVAIADSLHRTYVCAPTVHNLDCCSVYEASRRASTCVQKAEAAQNPDH